MTTRARLSIETLETTASGVARPRVDPRTLTCGVVHLGVGAFHRAHQAVFTEDAIAEAGGAWGIVGVSLRHPDVPDALAPQDGLYAVETLDPAGPRYRIVGALRQALCAPRAPAAVLAALAAPATHVVTLTVTEKGYGLDARGELDLANPDIAHDLTEPHAPRSAIGWLARALAERRASRAGPLTIVSCDNLMGNGGKLQAAVAAFAERADPALASDLASLAAFPQTMVDCIVPAVSPAVRTRIEAAIGLQDAACVSREAFAQWVIEDRFAGPRPAWDRAGAEIVADVRPYERLKLHVLNTVHSALAYLGPGRGFVFARQAMADPELAGFADGLIAEEVAPALADLPVADYWRRIRTRIANPLIDHRLAQIAEDGSAKLAQRVYPLIVANARAGRPTVRLAAIVRAWMGAAGLGEAADPKASRLADWIDAGADLAAALDDPTLFPEPFRADPAVRAAMLAGEELMRIVAIGECMVELREDGRARFTRGFAGDAYNTAVYLKRSAPDATVEFLTVTGEGSLSREMRAAWASEGISDALAFVAPGLEPGLYMIELDPRGDRSFHYWRSASAARRWLSLLEHNGGADRLDGADLVYLSGVSLAILPEADRARAVGLLRSIKRRVGAIAFDLNVRPALWAGLNEARNALAPVIGLADIVRASRDDAEALFGVSGSTAQIQALVAAGARELVLTLDEDGCLVVADGEVTALEPPAEVKVVDTTGAGDSFNGAYLARRLLGASPVAAAQAALQVAARKVGWRGAIAPAEVTHPGKAVS